MDIVAALAAALLLAAAPGDRAGKAADPSDECHDERGRDLCAAERKRVGQLFGLAPIEAHLEAGDEVRRAFYMDGNGRDVVAIEFIRAHGAAPELRVHFPRVEGKAPPPPLTAAVDDATWRALLRRTGLFERRLVPPPPPEKRLGEGETITVCVHGWLYTVEASELARSEYDPARVRHRTESSCDDGLTGAAAAEMGAMAVPLLPACARLDLQQHRNEIALLGACGLLTGDRLAGAVAMNEANNFRYLEGREDDVGDIQASFPFSGATVDWAGEAGPERGLAAFWVRKLRETGARALFIEAVDGESASRVRVRAALERYVREARGRRERAPVEQIWVRQGSGWVIERATVGAFAPVP